MTNCTRLYILDLDGTLVDSLDDLTLSVNAMRREFALTPLTCQAVRAMVGQGARQLVTRALTGCSSKEVEKGLAIFLTHNEAHLFDHTRLYPGVAPTLATLYNQGHSLALLSNKNEGLCRKLLAHFGIDRLFNAVLGGDSMSCRKPSPEPIIRIMTMLARPPGETFMVGDSINDMAAGRGASVATIGCHYGYGDPAELAEASFVIKTFEELLQLPL